MGRVEGKVALITGAARGQGRSHALRLAEEGADIVAIDICEPIASACHEISIQADLDETARLVEDRGRRVLARKADVRDLAALQAVADEAVAEFRPHRHRLRQRRYRELRAGLGTDRGGLAGDDRHQPDRGVEDGPGGHPAHVAARPGRFDHHHEFDRGTRRLRQHRALRRREARRGRRHRALAVELAQHHIRVNTVHPTAVDTTMIDNDGMRSLFMPDAPVPPTKEEVGEIMKTMNAIPVPWVETSDITNAVLFLASDEARYITGIQMPVDAGSTIPYRVPHM